MPFGPFKFKKSNAPTRLAEFDAQPSWGDLASKIAQLFNIPQKDVGVTYIDKAKDAVTITNEEELQRFYYKPFKLDQSSEEHKFVVQDLRTPDAPTTIASTWSADSNLSDLTDMWCLIEGDSTPFRVTAFDSASIDGVKELIYDKRKGAFRGNIGPGDLVLWKLNGTVALEPEEELAARVQSLSSDKLQRLSASKRLRDVFPQTPSEGNVHILVEFPAGGEPSTKRPRWGEEKNDQVPSTSSWLLELHRNLWGRKDIYNDIFRVADLSREHFITLQQLLHQDNPSRQQTPKRDVLSIKTAFLREKSVPLSLSEDPQELPDMPDFDIEDDDVTSDVDDPPNPSSDDTVYITDAANNLPDALFPYKLRYMDLTVLSMQHEMRVPSLMLIRDEWETFAHVLEARDPNIQGSVLVTGQPGIGKTCYLYYSLVQRFLEAKPTVFQDKRGNVFVITNTIEKRNEMDLPLGTDIIALVDADGDKCIPSPNVAAASNIKIVLASSPRTRRERRWLIQDTRFRAITYVMSPWTTQDLVVSAFFIYPSDILPHRLQEALQMCGTTPRRCLHAAESALNLCDAKDEITAAVSEVRDIVKTLESLRGNGDTSTSHRILQISPHSDRRSLASSIVEPVSEYALDQLMARMESQDRSGTYTMYRQIRGFQALAEFRGRLWENRVHKYFRSLSTATQFPIYSSVDRTANPLTIEFSSDVSHSDFARFQEFGGLLTSSVHDQKSCYLRPLSKTSATFDSFLYQPGFNNSEFQPLFCFQMTEAQKHDINLSGLQATQTACKTTIPELNALRPSAARKWIIVFVMPKNMGSTFGLQKIREESPVWGLKTVQYILELSPETVMQC